MCNVSDAIPFVVVECPSINDATFAARWLVAATEADLILTLYRKHHPDFERAIFRLRCHYDIEFGTAAMAFLRLWQKSGSAFALSLPDSEWAEPFAYMTECGFFTPFEDYYRMAHPPALTSQHVTRALQHLAGTEDNDHHFRLRTEFLLTTMTKEDACRTVQMIKRRDHARPIIPLLQSPC